MKGCDTVPPYLYLTSIGHLARHSQAVLLKGIKLQQYTLKNSPIGHRPLTGKYSDPLAKKNRSKAIASYRPSSMTAKGID
jgi:hypothetical protein